MQPAPHPLNSGQQRAWFVEETPPGVPPSNEAEAVRLLGELRADAMEQALNVVIARHEILRTTVEMSEDRPMAIVHSNWTLRMKRIDLSALAPVQRKSEVDRMLVDEPRYPYHLEREPGIRATLVRLGSREHLFILMMHHLVCDWAAEGTLWRELSSAYRAISQGEPLELPPLPIQHGDFVIWKNQQMTEKCFDEDLSFWENNLRGAPELLELPSDRPRPRVQSYRGARQRCRLDATLADTLRNYGREQKTSLFAVFAAAFSTLLYRYTGSEDILLGIPMADRELQEVLSVTGFLLQTHVLRTKLSGRMKFRELLPLVQKGLVALYSHREVPFDQVVSRIGPERSSSHSPLFQVMIDWRDGDQQLSFIGLDGLVVESLLAETRTSKFDLTLLMTDTGSDIWLEAEYSTDLFDDDRIARLFGHYQTLLEAVAVDPEQRLAQPPLLTDAERRQLLVEWNATETPFPQETCIHQLVEAQARRTPDAIALVFRNREITYRELNQRSNQLANHLRRLGIKADEPVAICVQRSIEMVIGLLGILKAGGAFVPLDPDYPQERLAFMLHDSQAALLLTESKLRPTLPADCRTLCLDSDWRKIADEQNSDPDSRVSPDNLAYVIYTSGSTGQPKGVEITHQSVVNLLSSMLKTPGLDSTDSLLAVTTLSFDIAVSELFLPLIAGAKVVIASSEEAANGSLLLALLSTSGATVIQGTPITFRMLIEAGWPPGSTRIKIICGGEVLSRALADQILERAFELWNCYGPTETTVLSSLAKVTASGPITIGRPINNTKLYVLDANGELCPIGGPGELYIGGAGLARGYLRQPELTAEKFVVNRFCTDRTSRVYRTGDMVRYLADGTIDYLGRTDHQVKVRGFRIELEEIESRLGKHPGIRECLVAARKTENGDERLVGYVVPLDPNDTPGVAELCEFLKQTLPDHMVPTAYVTLEKLPQTFNGKIDRKALPEPDPGRTTSAAGYVAPRTPIEETLAEIWGRVLGLKQVSIYDNFFALGGSSLQATRLIAEIHNSISHRFSILKFFKDPTIDEMARLLQEERQAKNQDERGKFWVVVRRGAKSLAVVLEDATLVELQTAQGRPPFFIVDSFPYFVDVVKLLGTDQPVLSLITPETARISSGYIVAEEAATHVQTILDRQPKGPYMLGGCSASGIVAYEVAQQLRSRGCEVGLLALFDTLNFYFMRDYSALRRSLAYNRAELKRMSWNEVPKWMATRVSRVPIRRSGALNSATLSGEGRNATTGQPNSSWLNAVRKYQPRPYGGRFLLFRCHPELGGRYKDELCGWGDAVAGKIEVYQLSAKEHLDIFKSELDRSLVAQKLRCAFDEVAKAFSVGNLAITPSAERRME